MKEEIRVSKDVVIKQVTMHRYIKKEVWHNPSPTLKALRALNRIVLCLLAIVLVYSLWYCYIPGENIIIGLMFVFIYLFFFSLGTSYVMNDIKLYSGVDSLGSIRVEICIYEKYLSEVRGDLYLRYVLLMLFLFVALLIWGAAEKTTMSDDRIFYYLVSMFSVLMVIVNSIFFSSLNMSLNKEMKKEIY